MQLCQPIWKSEIFCHIGPLQSPPASLHINIYNVNVGNIYSGSAQIQKFENLGDLSSDQISLNQSISKHKLKQKSNIVELQTLKKKIESPFDERMLFEYLYVWQVVGVV